jgi:hypothetical protein
MYYYAGWMNCLKSQVSSLSKGYKTAV